MSDDWLKMLLSTMQEQIKALTERVDMLEMALDEAMNGEAADPDQPTSYMDGTPISH